MPGDTMLMQPKAGPRGVADPDVAQEALAGLLAPRKTLPPKLFYDAEGCRLFGEITRLPEYYVTRTERALLDAVAPEIGGLAPARAALVEYGASDEAKGLVLLDAMRDPAAYVPIDVAEGALAEIVERLGRTRPGLALHPIAADFLRPLCLPAALEGVARLGFFPGSTIGNLEPAIAARFLATVRETLGAGTRFLIGVDLRKGQDVLIPAYDDAAGVTAAFNRNLLVRLNREAGGDFDPALFAHRAVWNEEEGRIEMHLESLLEHSVHVAGRTIRFSRGETIHTENSYKHTEAGFAALAGGAGWQVVRSWKDAGGLFSLQLLEAGAGR
jgi:L-histidine Nalpha-methyltransferase